MKTLRVVAAVIHAEGKVFATQRGYGEYKDGWEFPGGKIEVGETPEDAVRREIREELDTDISVEELIDTIEYDYPNFHLSMDCFWCEIVLIVNVTVIHPNGETAVFMVNTNNSVTMMVPLSGELRSIIDIAVMKSFSTLLQWV